MLKIGLTGNIGSGKTTVSKIFEVLGIPVFYADEAAKSVMVNDLQLIDELNRLWLPLNEFNYPALDIVATPRDQIDQHYS